MSETKIAQRIQDAFVLLAVGDTKFLQAARASIPPHYFGSDVTFNIIQLCYNYYDQFQEAPQQHFKDELAHFLRDKSTEKVDLYLTYLERIKELEPPNTAYVISRINKFVQTKELEKGIFLIAQMAKDGRLEEARNQMQSMLRVGIVKEEVGLRYLNNNIPTYLLPKGSNEKLMGTGLEPIDKRMVRGLCRTDFACLLGGYKGKKSWGCIHLGTQGLIHGLKVLHISHELSLEDTEMRYDMSFGGLASSMSEKVQDVTFEDFNESGETITTSILQRPTISDIAAVQSTRKTVGRFGGDLIIRKYPMGSCTMEEIVRYLDYLESFEGFIPDVVINDYIEKMKIPANGQQRDTINEFYIKTKGIADDRKHLTITVSQVTRDALRKRKLDQKDFAEDIRKLGNTDMVFAISQTDEQALENRMMWTVLANRHGAMDFSAIFAQNLDVGQFCINSWPYVPPRRRDRNANASANVNTAARNQPTGDASWM